MSIRTDGVGHITGSLLSSQLADHVSVKTIAILAASLCFLSVAINAVMLTKPAAGATGDAEEKKPSGLDIGKAFAMLRNPSLRLFMMFQLLVGTRQPMF